MRVLLASAAVWATVVAITSGGVRMAAAPQAPRPASASASSSTPAAEGKALIVQYCVGCHNERLKTGGLALDGMDPANVAAHPEIWEKVVRKLRGNLMPPIGRPRPDGAAYDRLTAWFERELDK